MSTDITVTPHQLPDAASLLPNLREEIGEEAADVSDASLLKFLRWKPSVSRAAERFRAHRTWRKANPFAFDVPSKPLEAKVDSDLRRVLESDVLVAPDDLTAKDGSTVLLGRLRNNDMSDGRTVEDVVRMFLYTIDRVLERESAQLHGVTVFHDLKGVSTGNIHRRIPRILLGAIIGNFPLKIAGMYILNAPYFFEVLFKVVSLLMPAKLRSRVHFVDSIDEVYKAIEKDELLVEHGGKRTHSSKEWVEAQMKREADGTLGTLADCYRAGSE